MLGWIGYQELLIMMVIVLLLFGSTKLPSLMRNLGRSATEFKRGMREDPDADGNSITDDKKTD
jgi:sec-independent protein translocase protein TatA